MPCPAGGGGSSSNAKANARGIMGYLKATYGNTNSPGCDRAYIIARTIGKSSLSKILRALVKDSGVSVKGIYGEYRPSRA